MTIELINTQKTLSRTQIKLADYAINPYKGCEFGCAYCYAQKNKNLRVKINAPETLEKELRYKNPRRVLLGSTTECFPRVEPQYRVTEKILEILNRNSIPYTILTKSDVINGYLHLIRENHLNKIYFTFNFDSNKIIKIFENSSPDLARRQETIKNIIAGGIDLRVHVGPYIPRISHLAGIFSLIPANVQEVDVELYHHEMGNFREILKRVEANLPAGDKEEINRIYKNKQNYTAFAQALKDELKELKQEYPFKIFYLVPEYGKFYTPEMDYESPLRDDNFADKR